MKKIILSCAHNIVWGCGVNQRSLMSQNSRCTVCYRTMKGTYVTSQSAEYFYCFFNSSDTAQSQKLKTINYSVFDRNPKLSVISFPRVWHIWAVIKKFKAAQRKMYYVHHYVINKTPFYKKESFHRINVNLNLSLNLEVMDNGHFNQTAGHICLFIYLIA